MHKCTMQMQCKNMHFNGTLANGESCGPVEGRSKGHGKLAFCFNDIKLPFLCVLGIAGLS